MVREKTPKPTTIINAIKLRRTLEQGPNQSVVEQSTVWCRGIELSLFEVQSGEQKILTFTSKLMAYTACVPAGSGRLFHSTDPSCLRALINLSEIL